MLTLSSDQFYSLGKEAGFRQVGESYPVIQAESESSLDNTGLKQKVTANNIVPFARKAAPVAA